MSEVEKLIRLKFNQLSKLKKDASVFEENLKETEEVYNKIEAYRLNQVELVYTLPEVKQMVLRSSKNSKWAVINV